MKKLLFVAFIAGAMLLSCSKKNNPVPVPVPVLTPELTPEPANPVLINNITYSTVKIGTQTWTSVNYNGPGGTNYNGSMTNNITYGKLYTIDEALAITLPTGWRLPTVTDMNTLLTYLGGTQSGPGIYGTATVANRLQSTSPDWTYTGGNNSSGFNAYPAGLKYNSSYEDLHVTAPFWSSSSDTYGQYCLIISYGTTGYFVSADHLTAQVLSNFTPALSIRFVRDN